MKKWFWGKGMEYAEFRGNVVEVTQWLLFGKRFAWRVRPAPEAALLDIKIVPLHEVLH